MSDKLLLKGIELRYVLTMHLFQHGKQSVVDLVDALDDYGFTTKGRPSKATSDALRCEITHARVLRISHDRYRPAWMPPFHRIPHPRARPDTARQDRRTDGGQSVVRSSASGSGSAGKSLAGQ
jgi:hypothetical protein